MSIYTTLLPYISSADTYVRGFSQQSQLCEEAAKPKTAV